MTVISTIIRDAYRESNLLALSADPTSDMQDEGLRLLQRLVSSLYGNEAGDPLETIAIGRNNISRPSGYPGYDGQPDNAWLVPLNTRLVLNLTSAQTVYLNPKPQDGSRFSFVDKSSNLATYNLVVNGNGYTVNDTTAPVFATNGLAKDYFFRADTGNWALVSTLAPSDSSPFPDKFDDMLIVGLAMRLNPRHGVAADPQSVEAYRTNMREFRAQYKQNIQMPAEAGLLRLTGRNIFLGCRDYYDPASAFDAGRGY